MPNDTNTTKRMKMIDDNIGRCFFCNNQVSRSDDWYLTFGSHQICHTKCNSEYMEKASQI